MLSALLAAALLLSAPLFADEPVKGGRKQVERLPYYLAEYAKEKPYPSISICRETFAEARFIWINETHRWSSSVHSNFEYSYTTNELLQQIDKDPSASLDGYKLLESFDMGNGFAYELRLIRESDGGHFGGDFCLSAIRRGKNIVWYTTFTGDRRIKEGLLAAVPHPDAAVLPDGRYMVATPGETYYIRQTAGKVLVQIYDNTRAVWYDGLQGSAGYIPPEWYPAVTILTDNVVRMTYPDGLAEHWKVILSKEDMAYNEERLKASGGQATRLGRFEGNLLWWNGKGRIKRFRVGEMQNRSYREGGPEPSYPGKLRRSDLSEKRQKEYLRKAPELLHMKAPVVQPGPGAKPAPEAKKEGTPLTRLLQAVAGSFKAAADFFGRVFGGSSA